MGADARRRVKSCGSFGRVLVLRNNLWKMKALTALAVLIVLGVTAGLVAVKGTQFRKMIAGAKAFAAPPETVSSTEVREETWPSTLAAIGSIVAAQGVTVTPDIPGTVREIAFESGALVGKDDLLVRLDVAIEEAQLKAMEAQLDLGQVNLKRAQKLREENTVSEAELDSASAAVKQLKANADAIRATIEKKTIRAPFAGQLGIRQINLGQYLEAGKPIVSLQSLSPVYAHFSLPQQHLAVLKNGMQVRLTTDAYAGREFEGVLTAMNPDLDASTRSVSLQATFQNPDQALRPGMFARVEVLLAEQTKMLVVPLTAVLSAPYGDSVYVIEPAPASGDQNSPKLTVRQQFIRTGRARGDYLSVQSGLKPGQRIVSSGIFKLRNGMSVVENNSVAPKASANPRPSDS